MEDGNQLMTVGRRAVILAGGRGSRLSPYTAVIPKPLLPIGDEAVLDVVVRHLRRHGFTQLTFAVGYLAHLIEAIFADGNAHGVAISYFKEDTPLGTAGALAHIPNLDDSFLMMNGDILTTLDHRELYRAHVASGNALTIASHVRTVETDYGVLHLDGLAGETRSVVGYEEKPHHRHVVSMGIYVVSPQALRYVTPGERLDVPELVLRLISAGERVGSYMYEGYWLDIGRHEDYQRAIVEYGQYGLVRAEIAGAPINGSEPAGEPAVITSPGDLPSEPAAPPPAA
jgi:NDP-sugar pyrophosphorylase family protein